MSRIRGNEFGGQGRAVPVAAHALSRAPHPSILIWLVNLLLSVILVLSGGPITAQAIDEGEQTDWPAVIGTLREAVYQKPDQARARQQLAVAYNNYGVSLGNQAQWTLAAQQLEEAVRLDSTTQQFRANLSQVYLNHAHVTYQHHQLSEAMDILEKAIALTPNLAQAYILKGEIEYDRQRLKEAHVAWRRALELDPTRHDVKQRLDQLGQELPVESKFERFSQVYFDLRYEEQFERPVGFDIRDALLEARRVVGSDFTYWPKYKIVVLIYSAGAFRAIRQQTPDWVAGQFDGKIRVPLPDHQLDSSSVKRIVFHEYTHAIVHDVAHGNCPTWLNEGLAEFEGRTQQRAPLGQLANASRTGRVLSWTQLSEHFSFGLPADDVALAYEQSYSIVHYLVDRYGFWRIRRILKAIAEGTSWDTAFATEFRSKTSKLEANWRDWVPAFLGSSP